MTSPTVPIPLQNAWSFWHDKFVGPGATVEEYDASLQKLCTFDSVQGFWQCYNNLPPVDQLKPKSSYHMMKRGIKPIWEDPQNENGGFWAMRVKKEDTTAVWRELLLACVGEQFATVLSRGDDICGLTVSVRQYDNIVQLWNRDAAAHTEALLDKVKKLLSGTEIAKAFYKPNKQHSAFTGPGGPAPGPTAAQPIPGASAGGHAHHVAHSPGLGLTPPPPGFAPKH